MDSSDSDYDMLDALAWNCTQLVGQLSEIQSSEEENILLEQYLNRIDSEFDSIADFKDGQYTAIFAVSTFFHQNVHTSFSFSFSLIL